MEPQLLYVFIKDINRCLSNQEFCFTNDFEIQYDLNERTLNINKKYNCYNNLWGERISNINLVVGQNGAGKTTLFDLMASTRDHRYSLFSDSIKLRETYSFLQWFSLYHIKDDIFVIEGNDELLISNIENIPNGTSREYSLVIKYDYERKVCRYENYIQWFYLENDENYPLSEKVIVLYGTNIKKRNWYKSRMISSRDDYYFGFKRKYLDSPLFTNLYHFMSNEYKSIEKIFTAQSIGCEIVRSNYIENEESSLKSEISKRFNLKLYNGVVQPLYFQNHDFNIINYRGDKEAYSNIKWTKKERHIIEFYEFYIIKTWMDVINIYRNKDDVQTRQKENCKKAIEKVIFEIDDYTSRIEYLKNIVNIVADTAISMYLPNETNYYAKAVIEYAEALEEIDESYFLSSTKIHIKLNGRFDENIQELLRIYDMYQGNDENIKNDLHNYVDIKFNNLSNGELEFINGFTSLYMALDIIRLNERFETVLIFLDEPDESFHPEWSRKYIYYLTSFLNSVEVSRDFRYQICISTHSPFMISDIPKEYITCLKITNKENGEIKRESIKAEFGLMSNFYDIIKNDFFISSPIGEFAKVKFDNILEEIRNMQVYDEKKIEQLKGVINAIGEEVIKKKTLNYLEKKVSQLMTPDNISERIALLESELRWLRRERDRID